MTDEELRMLAEKQADQDNAEVWYMAGQARNALNQPYPFHEPSSTNPYYGTAPVSAGPAYIPGNGTAYNALLNAVTSPQYRQRPQYPSADVPMSQNRVSPVTSGNPFPYNAISSYYQNTPYTAPVVPPSTGQQPTNAWASRVSTIPQETPKPTEGMFDNWGRTVFGKIPLDQFVQLAGGLSHAIAPDTPMGRAGGFLSGVATNALATRYNEPERQLRNRLLKAKVEEAELDWPSYRLRGLAEGKSIEEIKENFKKDMWEKDKESKWDEDIGYDPETQTWRKTRTDWNTDKKVWGRQLTPAEMAAQVTGTPKTTATKFEALVNPKTGERKWFDLSNAQEVAQAQEKGFVPYEKPTEAKTYEPRLFRKQDGTVGWLRPGEDVPAGWGPYEKGRTPEEKSVDDYHTISDIDRRADVYATKMNPKAGANQVSIQTAPGGVQTVTYGAGSTPQDAKKYADAFNAHRESLIAEAKLMGLLTTYRPPVKQKIQQVEPRTSFETPAGVQPGVSFAPETPKGGNLADSVYGLYDRTLGRGYTKPVAPVTPRVGPVRNVPHRNRSGPVNQLRARKHQNKKASMIT